MAAATTVATNIRQGVDSDGLRFVTATITFSTPGTDTYTTNGVPIDLTAIGLRSVRAVFEEKTRTVDTSLLTQAGWATTQATTTNSAFVDIATNGTPEAPKLVIMTAGAALSGAIPASFSYRFRFVGTA